MDAISQLEEQVNSIAGLALNTFGTLRRDAPLVTLSPYYPEPPANPMEESANFANQPKLMSAALVKAAKQFDTLVAALPSSEGGEEAQLRSITEFQVYRVNCFTHYCFRFKLHIGNSLLIVFSFLF
ncbi:mediator of RNA polymerase II transcription subunit 21-like isoform X1 [Durio zibethinus]|uniref:Mediator of RNA polymerase II transcription subunit 21 n=1 Tax=Durio zibethinus TaxID=66656 RepID=A0A6P5X870_DURZI|nr:mediator of RNA polymerase II transcription subunit 21-like isoform X1 [Durio zibethinus]